MGTNFPNLESLVVGISSRFQETFGLDSGIQLPLKLKTLTIYVNWDVEIFNRIQEMVISQTAGLEKFDLSFVKDGTVETASQNIFIKWSKNGES